MGTLTKFSSRLVRRLGRLHQPFVGAVDLGDLARTTPVSRYFGYDRGTPIDRFYIEDFFDRFSSNIRGRVLEVGDTTYSERFGCGVTQQEVLHLHQNSGATIVADIAETDSLPARAFDCIILPQTLQFIYDIGAAVREVHRALRPAGVVLATVPGISSRGRGEWADRWCWSLTEVSARNLFGQSFAAEDLNIAVYGNVYAATCFLQGLALEEVDKANLKQRDSMYPVIVGVCARRSLESDAPACRSI